jgi:hypothetical protein
MEGANLKQRHKDVFERLVAQWNEWNSTMLPLDPQSFTAGSLERSSPIISASKRRQRVSCRLGIVDEPRVSVRPAQAGSSPLETSALAVMPSAGSGRQFVVSFRRLARP